MILASPLTGSVPAGILLGLARVGAVVHDIGCTDQGRPLHGVTIGDGDLPLVSVVAGAHPDEPAGPVAALRLVFGYQASPLAGRVRLAVVPQMDADGAAAQAAWLSPWTGRADPARVFAHRLRRAPGEDREFAWPGAPWAGTVLPECRAAAGFLDGQGPAIAHLSLHGMFIAGGAWFLLDRLALSDSRLWAELRGIAAAAGLGLHDMPRNGDKGFRRAGPGFCTTPSGYHMRRWLMAEHGGIGTSGAARAFGLGSMDAARQRAVAHNAPPPLCAVSEFPLIAVPAISGCDLATMKSRGAEIAALAADPPAIEAKLVSLGAHFPSLDTLAESMLAMVHAVSAAALRRPCHRRP